MKNLHFLSVVVMTTTLLIQGCATSEQSVSPTQYEINFVPAKTNSELVALSQNSEANLLRTAEQVDFVVKNNLSPLAKLSKENLILFKEHLVPGVYGFASIYAGILEKSLSTNDYNTVMATFGLDTKGGFWGHANAKANTAGARVLETDYRPYECDGKHNCRSVTADVICTSNC